MEVIEIEKSIPQNLKDIYNRLQDDESKMIFRYKLQYFLDGDERHLVNMLTEVRELDLKRTDVSLQRGRKTIESYHPTDNGGKPAILYGAGGFALFMQTMLDIYGVEADLICDKDAAKTGKPYLGRMVISPEQLVQYYPDRRIVIASSEYTHEIYDDLVKLGINSENIYLPIVFSGKIYFDFPFIDYGEDEIYIDAGAYCGETLMDFIKYSSNYKKIYAFEPDPDNYEKLIGYISKNDINNVHPLKKGVWSSSTILHFNSMGNEDSRIEDQGDISIETVSIDEIVKDERITFIKMDVEGAELEALKGAAEVIRNSKPKLAICVYHKPEDILEIPMYLMKLVPDYKFHIRHHHMSYFETVLYAVC